MQLYICLAIFLLTIISFTIGKISMGTTALLALVALVLTGCLSYEEAFAFFSDSSVILVASMFVLSAGLSKTSFIATVSRKVVLLCRGSYVKILAGYVIIAAFLVQIIPAPLAVFSVVFPPALAISKELKVHPSQFMFPLGVASVAACYILPLGGSAVIEAQINSLLEAYQCTGYSFSVMDIAFARSPSLIVLIIYLIFFAPKFIPKKPYQEQMTGENAVNEAAAGQKSSLTPFHL